MNRREARLAQMIGVPGSAGRLTSCTPCTTHAASRRPRTKQHASNGFTLIEMMVVIILIGILTAAIIPEMRGTYQDALLRATSRELINEFGLASSRAISRNQVH